jgi:hypothetical protein
MAAKKKTTTPKPVAPTSTKVTPYKATTAKGGTISSKDAGPTSRVTNAPKEKAIIKEVVSPAEKARIAAEAKKAAAAAAAKAGSGSGRNPLNDYTQQLQSLIKGGDYGKPYDQLQSQLEGIYGTAQSDLTTNRDTDITGINTLYGDAQKRLTTNRDSEITGLGTLYGGAQTALDARNKTGLANLQTGYDTARTSLGNLNTQAGKTINASMDSLQAMLQGQANPYADLQAQAVNPTAQLSSFLQGQNVGDQQTQDYAQVLNAQNAGSAGAFNNLAGVLRSIAGADKQGALSDVAVQRDASTRQLASNNQAYGNQLTQGLLADQLKMGQTYDANTFDLSKGLLSDTSGVNRNYNQNTFDYSKGQLSDTSNINQAYGQNRNTYNQGLMTATQGIASDKTGQQNDLIKQMLAAIAKGGVPKKGKLF